MASEIHEQSAQVDAEGALRPIVHAVLPLAEAQRAHEMVAASEHFGKVVLDVRGGKSRS